MRTEMGGVGPMGPTGRIGQMEQMGRGKGRFGHERGRNEIIAAGSGEQWFGL